MNSSLDISLGQGNSTGMANAEDDWVGTVEAVLLGLILLTAVLGNALVCAVVYRRKELHRTVTHIFIVSLAVTDISVALLCMPFSIITAVSQTWIYSVALCQLNGLLNVFFLLASILTLTAISVHKYIRVVKPVHCLITRRRALIGLACVWFLALFTAVSPLMGWNRYEYIEGRTQCSLKVPKNAAELTNCLFVIICGFVVPLGVMSFSYHKIFHTVKTHTKRVRLSQVFDKREMSAFLSEKRVTITLFIILAVFLGCWAPFSVLTIYATVSRKELSKHFSVAAYWLGFLNSALNPVIYALRTKEFRDGYREILGIVFPCCFNKNMRRTLNTTFKWSQADQRSRRSSAVKCEGITKANSVSAERAAQDRKRTATNVFILQEEDIALDERLSPGDVHRDKRTNRREKVPADSEDSLGLPEICLDKDEAARTTSTNESNLPVAQRGIYNRCFAGDHDDGEMVEREIGCSKEKGNETAAPEDELNTQVRKRSLSDSAVKYRKQRRGREDSSSFRQTGRASVCSTHKPRSENINQDGGVNSGRHSASISGPGFSHSQDFEFI